MEWTRAVDGYCERLDPSFWAEPVNAATNAAFVLAALWMWARCAGLVWPRALAGLLAAIGAGSFLFHTFAMAWAGVADVVPILLFVLVYAYCANRFFWRFGVAVSTLGALAVVPWLAVLTPVFARLPGFAVSAMYWPIPLLIALYALSLRPRLPEVARGLGVGVALFCVSLVFRSLDGVLCGIVPLGTHWVWHVLNAAMLGWMIEVLRRRMLEADAAVG